jgi:RNA recognition motif-containing protein
VSLCGHEVGQVDWAEPENEVDDAVMSTVRVLFVRNLMLATTEEALRVLFNRLAGSAASSGGGDVVERVKKTKDFAFVHFTTRAAAEAALAASANNNSNGGGGGSGLLIDGAEVEVLWSKPVDKKLYNARKTLTKAFTHGSEIVDNESGRVQVYKTKSCRIFADTFAFSITKNIAKIIEIFILKLQKRKVSNMWLHIFSMNLLSLSRYFFAKSENFSRKSESENCFNFKKYGEKKATSSFPYTLSLTHCHNE